MTGNRFRGRVLLQSAAIGAVAAGVCWALFPLTHGADFSQFHFAARQWLSGHDPYKGGFPIMRATRVVPEPFFYPFPALLLLAPFSFLPLRAALVAFIGVFTTLLAYGVLRRSPERLPLFLGAGFFVAIILGQWSPLVVATVLLPRLAWLAVIKPNIGLATTAARPTLAGIFGGAALLIATLAIQPNWPAEWLHNLHSMPPHPAPIMVPGGALALLAVLRWRRTEARLLIAMACVPQLLYFADQLPLWLVPETRRESMFLSATSVVAWGLALIYTVRTGLQPPFDSGPFVLAGVYLPALIMILRRPNEGSVPEWVERVATRAPDWLRGQAQRRDGRSL